MDIEMSKFVKLCIALSLLMWFPLFASAYDDWIYELNDENGNRVKTIISWDTWITIRMDDLPGSYKWGTMSTFQSYSGDNNAWWWGNDTSGNNYSPNPSNLTGRQWPCDTWYHVPSAWEWSKLLVSWCSVDKFCSSTDLGYHPGSLAYLPHNNVLQGRFRSQFNMWYSGEFSAYWSSSYNDESHDSLSARYFYIDSGSSYYVSSESSRSRDDPAKVRCMKNVVVYPAKLTENSDWSKTIEWSGINLTIAWNNLSGFYWWGTTGLIKMHGDEVVIIQVTIIHRILQILMKGSDLVKMDGMCQVGENGQI